MRRRIALLAASALVAFLAGCGKGTTNSNGTNSATGNTNTTTTTTPSPTSTATTSTTPTTTTASAASPTAAFNAYYEAVKNKDANAAKSLFSKGTLSMLEERAKRQNTNLDAVLKEGMEEASKEVPATMPQTRNEKIDGDKATLEVNDEKKDRWETLHFVREDGNWKISFDRDEAK